MIGAVRIEIVVFDGFDEIDAFGPFEVLSTEGFSTSLVVIGPPRTIISQGGLQLVIADSLGDPDGVVVPGGGWLNRAVRGSWAEVEKGDLTEALRGKASQVQWLASVCTGALVLAAAGLLDGRFATTNRNAFDELRPHVRDVLSARVVDEGDRITAAGLTAGIDLGLWIIERTLGKERADQRAGEIEYERQGRVWTKRNGND